MVMVSQPFSAVVGVDTHARTHTYAVLDARTGQLDRTATFPTTPAGLARAEAWIGRIAGPAPIIAIEGSGSYGATLAHALSGAGYRVAEMDAPEKRSVHAGKSDPLDAEQIARRALAHPDRLAQPRTDTGPRAIIQILLAARSQMTRSRTAAVNALTALVRIHSLGIDARRALTPTQIATIAAWRPHPTDSPVDRAARAEATRLATQIRRNDTELADNLGYLHTNVRALAPGLLENPGVGPVSAAQILAAYSHRGRIRSDAAFARLAGTAPIPASSGNTIRHRMDHGGDRQLNTALWRIAFYRYHHDPDTITYAQKRRNTGDTTKEIIRSLQHYIGRSLYRQLNATMLDTTP